MAIILLVGLQQTDRYGQAKELQENVIEKAFYIQFFYPFVAASTSSQKCLHRNLKEEHRIRRYKMRCY